MKIFAQRHPGINFVIGLILLVLFVLIVMRFIWFVFSCVGSGIEKLVSFLKKFVSIIYTVMEDTKNP